MQHEKQNHTLGISETSKHLPCFAQFQSFHKFHGIAIFFVNWSHHAIILFGRKTTGKTKHHQISDPFYPYDHETKIDESFYRGGFTCMFLIYQKLKLSAIAKFESQLAYYVKWSTFSSR